MHEKCSLILSNNEVLEGYLIGKPTRASGEMVFTTGMVGYSEAITDPSYFGQILVFTYPLVGNYGIPSLSESSPDFIPSGFESLKAQTKAVVITTDSPESHHWNSFRTLDQWLKEQGITGIVGIDTRHLVHQIRSHAQLMGKVVPGVIADQNEVREIVSQEPFFDPGSQNILSKVSTPERRVVGAGKTKIGLIDCGVKWNIVRQLLENDCEVELIPYDADFDSVDCDAWLLSNGPGNPKNSGDLIASVRKLLEGDKPILGICLGHQVLSLAAGAATERMAYGHRGHNQPVFQVGTRKGFITSQNHGYVVTNDSLPDDWDVWFLNVNDHTNEGIRHKYKPFRSVQFHPEAAGGPRDTGWILNNFVKEVRGSQHA